ncbi:11087_t:CDS:2, partial [Gigaspora margarita]
MRNVSETGICFKMVVLIRGFIIKIHEFRQISRVEFVNELNGYDDISPNNKDISRSSLLPSISNLGTDLIDID